MVFLLPLLTPSAHAAPGEARADLATVLTDAVVLGGASGHCPVPGAPVDRTYGSDWRPLGFSPAGAFASIALTTTDLGSPTWTVQVVSLVDDTELGVVRHEHRTDGLPTIDAFLAAERPAIDALLAEHGIVPAVQPLAPLPLSLGDATLSVTIEDLSERNSHPHHHFRLTASRSDVGSKQVAEPRGQSLQVLGALQSPYEPRVALVLLNPRPAIEATTDCRITVVGAHTETGFR